jgi:hypothetical protein
VKANVKQVIEGKAASKLLKTQSDAVVTMGTKAKMASAGMAMYSWIPHNTRRQFWVSGPNSVNSASTPVLGLEIESEHPKRALQAIRFGPKLSPWCWVNGSWVILAGIRAKPRQ